MTYADDYNLRSATNISLNNVASAIDGLLIGTSSAQSAANQVVSSTSAVALTGMSQAVTVAAGQSVLVAFSCQLDIQTVNDIVTIAVYRDATLIYSFYTTARVASEEWPIMLLTLDRVPGAGTYTYAIKASNSSASLTTNFSFRQLFTIKVQEE